MTREEKIEEARQVFLRTPGKIEDAMTAVLEHFNVIPPKPAPTRGEAMSLNASRHNEEAGCVTVFDPDGEMLAKIYVRDGSPKVFSGQIGKAVGAWIDHALAAPAPAVDAARLERIAEEFIRQPGSKGVDVGGMWFGTRDTEYATDLLRRKLVNIMQSLLAEGGNSK